MRDPADARGIRAVSTLAHGAIELLLEAAQARADPSSCGSELKASMGQRVAPGCPHLWAGCAEPVLRLGTRCRGWAAVRQGAVLEKISTHAAADKLITH